MPPRRAAVLQVFVFKDGQFVGTDVFAENRFIIGRDRASADMVLESAEVSRAHAVVEHDGERVFISDAGSTNGVYLNDAQVQKGDRVEVTRLDQVLIGEFALKIKLMSRTEEARVEPERTRLVSASVAASPSSPSPAVLARSATPIEVENTSPKPASKRPDHKKAARREPVLGPQGEQTVVEAAPSAAPELWRNDSGGIDARALEQAGRPSPVAAPKRAVVGDRERSGIGAEVASPGVSARGAQSIGSEEPTHVGDEPRAKPAPKPTPSKYQEPARRSPEPPAHVWNFSRLPPAGADEEDEDEDENFVPPFSLAELLVQRAAANAPRDPTHLEVITLLNGRITDQRLLRPGQTMWTGVGGRFTRRLPGLAARRRLIAVDKLGRCRVSFPSSAKGSVLRAGNRFMALAQVSTPGRGGFSTLALERGDVLELNEEPKTYHVRFVRPPSLPVDERPLRERLKPEKIMGRSMVGSFGGHLLILLLGIIMPSHSAGPAAQTESFAEVTLEKEVRLEEPTPEPPKAPEPPSAAPTPEPPPKSMEAAPSKRVRTGGTSKAPPGVLGLLSKTGSSAAPGPAAALAAVSNLSAATAPAGASGFRVSGLAGKLATSDILIGGGGGGVVTKGGAALLRGGGGGGGQLAGQGTRGVGGIVQKMPQEMRSVGQGSLDRDAIQKVINQNVGQIQRCYERELVQNPGLSGKVEVEWIVALSGSVKTARQKFSNLNSSAAVNCMLDKIKGWKFPNPKGGEVVVSYPFVFKSISY